MICPKCGKEIADHAKFCSKCGTSIAAASDGAAPANPSPPAESTAATATAVKPPKKRKGKAFLVAVPVVAILIAAALFLFPRLSGSPEPEGDTPGATNASDTVQAADAELLALIDQAEAAHKEAADALPDLMEDADGDGMIDDISVYVERTRQCVSILSGFLTDLDALREKAALVSGLDDKMKTARDEYFNMLHDARAAHIETLTFLADYLEYYNEVIAYRPLEVDYEDLEEYAIDLSAWTQEAREGYAAISCPTCVENEWTQYGEHLDYNESIAQKLNLAIQYNDWLRYYSTKNMTSRYMTVESNLYDKFLDNTASENRHAGDQKSIASSLAKEMHTYAEMSQEDKDAYGFQWVCSGEMSLDYDVVDTIYPSLYNTYDAFVIMKASCISGTRDIVVEAEIPGFTQKYMETFRLDSSYQAIYIKPPALTGELDLSATKDAQVSVRISEQDGTLIEAKTFPVTLKSKYDFDWYSDEYGVSTQDNILCFLTPESSAIATLKRTAIDEITDLTGSRVESFAGYQNVYSKWNQYMITYLQTAGLMRALYEDLGVRYNMDPFSLSGSNQHILFPEDVIAQQSGLCVETSLAVASALQSANMHAFLLFPPGHAQVAVEVWNSGDHKGEYFLIETTALDSSQNNKDHFIENANRMAQLEGSTGIITYYDAAYWKDYLENNVEYLVDCDDSRLLGLTPFAN